MSKGLKLEELDSGEMYKCRLTGRRTLVLTQAVIVTSGEGDKAKTEEVNKIYGKCSMTLENGEIKYFVNELYDGQLRAMTTEEINKD